MLRLQSITDALVIAERIVQGGRLHLDVVGAHGGVHVDLAVGDGLPHHLTAGACLFRHEDHDVAVDLGDAGQTEALFFAFFGEELGLYGTPIGHVPGRRLHTVALEEALLDPYLALATGALLAANAFDLHPELAAGLEDGLALLNLASSARRLKDHGMRLVLAQKSPLLLSLE